MKNKNLWPDFIKACYEKYNNRWSPVSPTNMAKEWHIGSQVVAVMFKLGLIEKSGRRWRWSQDVKLTDDVVKAIIDHATNYWNKPKDSQQNGKHESWASILDEIPEKEIGLYLKSRGWRVSYPTTTYEEL